MRQDDENMTEKIGRRGQECWGRMVGERQLGQESLDRVAETG
jgi:hypothetical protein